MNNISQNITPRKNIVTKPKFAVLSIAMYNNENLFNVHGIFDKYEDPLNTINELVKNDKSNKYFIAQFGKWNAIYYDLSKMSENNYNRTYLLNHLMKLYKYSLTLQDQYENKRRNEKHTNQNTNTYINNNFLNDTTNVLDANNHNDTNTTEDDQQDKTIYNLVSNVEEKEEFLDCDTPLKINVNEQNYFVCSLLNKFFFYLLQIF